jgi:hypothetical protein
LTIGIIECRVLPYVLRILTGKLYTMHITLLLSRHLHISILFIEVDEFLEQPFNTLMNGFRCIWQLIRQLNNLTDQQLT